MEGETVPELWVAGDTPVKSLAGSIAGHAREHHETIRLKAIGAGAINTAIKSIATARGYVASEGMDLLVAPAFWVEDNNEHPSGQLTGILLTVKVGREG